jgi:hypothetical protein
MPSQRRGQMYIVTMVFLAAMVFGIQGLLLAYSDIDLSRSYQSADPYIIDNIEDIFQSALESSSDCMEASDNIIELRSMMNSIIQGGYELRTSGDVNCTDGGDWPATGPDLALHVTVFSERGESSADFELYHGAAPQPPQGTVVFISPTTQSKSHPSTLTVDVSISDVADLHGFQFDLRYDGNILNYQSMTGSPFLESDGCTIFCVPEDITIAGLVKNAACARQCPGGIDGNGVLAELTFDTVGVLDKSQIDIENVLLSDSSGSPISFSVTNGSVEVK